MRSLFVWAVLLILALMVFPLKATDWSLDIVPQSSRDGEQRIILSDPFQVVLTNTTDHDLMLWKEWCSWGYVNLSFEFSDKAGKVTKVTKQPIPWTRNGPSGFVVKPGKHFVLSVTLKGQVKPPDTWTEVDSLNGVMTVKAIYKCTNEAFPGTKSSTELKIPDDMQKLIDSAWVGQVESEPIQVTIVR